MSVKLTPQQVREMVLEGDIFDSKISKRFMCIGNAEIKLNK